MDADRDLNGEAPFEMKLALVRTSQVVSTISLPILNVSEVKYCNSHIAIYVEICLQCAGLLLWKIGLRRMSSFWLVFLCTEHASSE